MPYNPEEELFKSEAGKQYTPVKEGETAKDMIPDTKEEIEKLTDEKIEKRENHTKNIEANGKIIMNEEPFYDSNNKAVVKEKKQTVRSILYDLVFYALLIFVCIYILPNYVIQRTIVEGASMENTLHNGEQLYVEKISYRLNALDRFDIIVFYPYGRENEEYYVKRIIGLPGETIQIIRNKIYINGEVLEEEFGKEPILDSGRAKNPIKLGENEYFVLGDNRNNSKDSRYEEVGNVSNVNIGGKVIFRIKPLSKFGTVD